MTAFKYVVCKSCKVIRPQREVSEERDTCVACLLNLHRWKDVDVDKSTDKREEP